MHQYPPQSPNKWRIKKNSNRKSGPYYSLSSNENVTPFLQSRDRNWLRRAAHKQNNKEEYEPLEEED